VLFDGVNGGGGDRRRGAVLAGDGDDRANLKSVGGAVVLLLVGVVLRDRVALLGGVTGEAGVTERLRAVDGLPDLPVGGDLDLDLQVVELVVEGGGFDGAVVDGVGGGASELLGVEAVGEAGVDGADDLAGEGVPGEAFGEHCVAGLLGGGGEGFDQVFVLGVVGALGGVGVAEPAVFDPVVGEVVAAGVDGGGGHVVLPGEWVVWGEHYPSG
jgi:hypothetical protein